MRILKDGHRRWALMGLLGISALGITAGASSFNQASAASHLLMVSTHADRSSYVPVAGAQLSGTAYIFTENLPASTTEVDFFLDGKQMADEHLAPYDFVATAADGTPKPFDIDTLSAGQHQVVYYLYYGGKVARNTATFTATKAAPVKVPPITVPATTTTSTTAKPIVTTPTTAKPIVTTPTTAKPAAPSGGGNLTSLINANGAKTLALGSGNYSFSDFASSNAGATVPAAGIQGVGIGATVLQMNANTSTKKSLVPAQPTKYSVAAAKTNPLYLLRATGSPTLSGFTLQGTAQGHLYNGLMMQKTTNAKVSNVKVSAIPGNLDTPPGETFSINDWATTGSVYNNVEIDGANTAASGFATNSSSGVTVENSYFHDTMYGAGATFWQTKNLTITNTKSINDHDAGFNFERVTGTVTMRSDTTGGDKLADIRIGNDQGSATYNIYDPVYSGSKLVIMLTPGYNGTTNLQKKSDIHVFVNGVDKTSTVVQWKTSW